MYNNSYPLAEIAKATTATSIFNKIPSTLSLSSYIQEFNKTAFESAIKMSNSIKKFETDMIKSPISAVEVSKIKSPCTAAMEVSKIKSPCTAAMDMSSKLGDQMSKIAQSANMLNNHSLFNDFVKKITENKFRF
jgi:hypothetical protein